MGQKALVIQVDMKWGLIDCMPSLNELTIVTLFKRNSHINCKMNVSEVLTIFTLLHLGTNKK